ncbi:MAG: DNRLRE domain-containing protein [Anaerolineae bacterium]|nr:DNRLRE domain-containing protein [Anaerolineae bacterium]
MRAVATDAPALDQSAPAVFTMPPVAFNALVAEPDAALATNGVPLALDVALTNVGNVSATFEVLALAPNGWGAGAPFTLPLAPGATGARPYTLLPAGSAPGDVETIRVQSPAPGSPYVQEDTVNVTVVGPCVYAAAQAAEAARMCANAEDAKFCVSKGVALDDLVTQLARWELDETNAGLPARVRSAVSLLREQLDAACRDAKFCVSTDLTSLTAAASVADFCAPLSDLGDDLDRLAQRRVSARFVPGYDAALPGTPVTYTLRLANHGTLTTTYRTNLRMARIANGQIANQQIVSPGTTWLATIAPGQVATTPVVILPESRGVWTLDAQVEAVEDAFIQTQTAAGLNVVDTFIRVTDVAADPAFVEAGNNTADLYVSVANVANVYRSGHARVSISAPSGAAVFTDTVPVTIPGGLHWSIHALGSVNVAGWSEGAYTMTVQIVDRQGRPIPDGWGIGALVVGKGVAAQVAVLPGAVAPGDARVTTVITTERTAAVGSTPVAGMENVYTFYLPDDTKRSDDYDGFYVVGLRPTTLYQVQHFDESAGSWEVVVTDTVALDDVRLHFSGYLPDNVYRVYADNPLLVVVTSGEGSLVSAVTPELKFRGRHFTFLGDYADVLGAVRAVIFALENETTVNVETRPLTGTWSAPDTNVLPAGAYWDYAKDTEGTVLVRVTADKDLIVYRTSEDNDELDTAIADNGTPYGATFYFAPVPYAFPNVFVLRNTEPDEANVAIYNINNPSSPVVVWQGTLPPLGAVSAVPNGGKYFRIESDRTLSVIGGGVYPTQLTPGKDPEDAIWELLETRMGNRYLYQTNLLYSHGMELVEEYTEFATGLHGQTEILTEIPLVDKTTDLLWGNNHFTYLSGAPVTLTLEVITPTIPPGLYRREENYGIEYSPTAWARLGNGRASRGYYARSRTAGQAAALTFAGNWVGVGFLTANDAGKAEVFVDGVSYGVVDTYSRDESVKSVYYDLPDGSHTISVTVLGVHHPNSSGNWVRLDYVDTWNGDPPSGLFEEDDARVIAGSDCAQIASAEASGGHYCRGGDANVWFGFAGDSVTYQALANTTDGEVEVLVDGELRGRVNLKSRTTQTQTFSLAGLGAGPHVLQVRAYRDQARVDAFIAPGVAPFYTPPVRAGVTRYEEDDVTVRYGEASYAQRPTKWGSQKIGQASDGYGVLASAISHTVSLTFTGAWVGVGYVTRSDGAEAEVWIDGVYKGTVDTYAATTEPRSIYYGGLASGEHAIVVQTLGTRFCFDYFDVWDGTPMPGGWSETPFASSWDWTRESSSVASGGQYYRSGAAMWYAFTGDSVMYQTLANATPGEVEISLDGVTQSVVSLYNATPITRTFNFTGLAAGPHVLQVRKYSGQARVDAFAAPVGTPPPVAGSRLERVPGLASLMALAPLGARAGVGDAVDRRQFMGTVETDLTLDGVPLQTLTEPGVYTVVLPAGRHALGIEDNSGNVALTGVEMERNAFLVWNLAAVPPEAGAGVHASRFWNFISDEPLQIRQGGSGNCWIHTLFPYNYGESYTVDLTHTAPLAGVEVISGTFSTPPLTISLSGQTAAYAWTYDLIPGEPAHATSFEMDLAGMQPGETRRVSESADVRYTTLGGQGRIFVGPRYVSAAHIVALAPYSATTAPGNCALYNVTLSNPTDALAVYTLTVSGLSQSWVTLSPTATVAAGASLTLPLALTPPPGAELGDYAFAIVAATPSGGLDQAPGALRVADLLALTLTPLQTTADYGAVVTFTLTISNEENTSRTYDLALTGLENSAVTLPATLSVPANSAQSVAVTAMAHEPLGTHLLTVQAGYAQDGAVVSAQAHAALAVRGEPGLALALAPPQAIGGPASPAVYTLLVTNTGTLADSYDLGVAVPDGWTAQVLAHGAPVGQISLTPYVFNGAALQVLVTPPPGALPGVYPLAVHAASTRNPVLTATADAAATVAASGVAVALDPPARSADLRDTLVWNVTLANTGSVADVFALTAGGVVVGNVAWSANSVPLEPGASATVQLTASGLDFATPQTYPLSVEARSQTVPQVFNAATATVTFAGFAGVEVSLLPPAQTVSATQAARYLAIITNTGNTGAVFTLTASADPALSVLDLDANRLYLPPHMTAQVLLIARAAQPGTYPLTVQASGPATAVGVTVLTVAGDSPEPLPPDCIAVGETLTFTGTYTDPGWLDTHAVTWTFGDGTAANGPLTVTHAYTAPGVYPVTLIVADDDGGVGQATFTVTIGCPACVSVQRGASGVVADAYVWSGDWADNGNGARLYSGYLDEFDPAGRLRGYLFCPARGLPEGGPALSLLRFDWAGVLPDGAYLLTATLGLTQSAASAPGQPVYVQRILSAWDESTVTWGSFLEDFDSEVWGVFTPTASATLHFVDVTALVRSWQAGTFSNHGLVLNQPIESGYTVYLLSESTDPAQRPWLRMCYLR